MRGSGDSDGVLLDEYLPQEQLDGVEVVAWLAAQPWCTGRVGIIGKSWGGFNGLQIAAHDPPALAAVISVCSTDDRYADDVHYMGGCLLAWDSLSWATTMLAFNAQPPDPAVVGERWRDDWLARMDATPPYSVAWVSHQRRDEFWKQGSVCEDFAAIDLPRLHGRRLGRRLPRRDLPAARGLPGREPRADRAVGAPLPGVGRARPRDRLPAGVRALVGPLAQGRRQRHRARAEGTRLDAGARRAGAVVPAARGPLGRRAGRGRLPGSSRSASRSAPARSAHRRRPSWS